MDPTEEDGAFARAQLSLGCHRNEASVTVPFSLCDKTPQKQLKEGMVYSNSQFKGVQGLRPLLTGHLKSASKAGGGEEGAGPQLAFSFLFSLRPQPTLKLHLPTSIHLI